MSPECAGVVARLESATTDEAILACLPVLKQLRPTIVPESFVVTVRRMEVDGYQLVALRDPEVVAVAGYRVIEMFATRPHPLNRRFGDRRSGPLGRPRSGSTQVARG